MKIENKATTFFKATVLSMMLAGTAQAKLALDSSHKLPIDVFASMPAMTKATVSKDGSRIAVIKATSKSGEYIVEVRSTSNLAATPVRLGASHMEITSVDWLNNEKLLLNLRQKLKDGNREYWVSKVAIVRADGKQEWLVPFRQDERASFSLVNLLPNDPANIILNYDINNDGYPDVVKYNINRDSAKTVVRGTRKISRGFISDVSGDIRAAVSYDMKSNAYVYLARLEDDSEWREIYKNTTDNRQSWDFLSFSVSNPDEIYIKANRDKDTAGIYTYNIRTDAYSERLFGLETVDVDSIILSNKSENLGELVGYSYTSKQQVIHYVNDYEAALNESIAALFPKSQVQLQSRSEDDSSVVVYTESDKDAGSYFLLKDKKELIFLGSRMPALKPDHLSKVKYVKIDARDGLKIPAYVTIPKGKAPFPTVVMPHGGPWARDTQAFDEWAQFLANQGYLVVQPQFRGSTGFGLAHWKAGDKQWGLSMQDDLDDAASFLVEKGLAQKDKLAMFGWSYGGYAALVASTRTNQMYRCAIAGAAVTDLDRWRSTVNRDRFVREFQGPTMYGVSPIEQAQDVNIPLLMIHGDIDSRVPIVHSRDFVDELEKHNINFKYVELEGADHFSNTLDYSHKTTLYSEMLMWLSQECNMQ